MGEHQKRTVANSCELHSVTPDLPIVHRFPEGRARSAKITRRGYLSNGVSSVVDQ
jgi:hypothetical protein